MTLTGMAVLTAVHATSYTVNFFGMMKCEFDKVKAMLLIALVIIAMNYAIPSIRAMIKIPELAPIALNSMKVMMASAIAMFTMNSASASTGSPLKKCECESGIVSNGSCWICRKEDAYPFRRATRDAKNATRGKSCKNVTDPVVKKANAILWSNLIIARLRENSCCLPPDTGHEIALVENYKALLICQE